MSGQFGSAFPAQPGFQNNHTQPPLFDPTPSPFNAMPARKRRAESPPTDFQWTPPEQKRRRPNLHNGFATMSITPQNGEPHRPQYSQGQGSDISDDELLEPTRPPIDGDVSVEVLSDKHTSPTSARRPTFPHRRSSSSTSPSEEEDYESDVTFRPPLERERRRQAQHTPMQPTSIEHPEQEESARAHLGTPVVEFESPLKRKHLRLDDDRPHASKRQKSYMEDDVPMDAPPVSSGPGWYEPEKDRIVVTSLSSPEPSSGERSPSPDPGPRLGYSYEEHKHLTQPGSDGFMISPSLLTHLMAAQGDQFRPSAYNPVPERGLVLYRPLGVPGAENVVKQWDEEPGRFEELDEDEDMQNEPAGQWGDGIAQDWGQSDDAMDIE